ncbi:class A beta-lactamase-related serine hydrolase [Brachybacterium sp. JHP9]|uniref:Class A beta-lactamase-related serine hydrolase n=1 Tax=Brachybacterium equifaecis TaxID=2910770 RepID=A0ABT0QZ32_9MICO|nr:serine hydrolase [Brachybacterium equifaecis]MCL6422922.1 class A beta-lactamase-related serine hydrolase [Brachybacterium equifaecis]
MELSPAARWSIGIQRADGTVLAEHEPHLLLKTASIAKLHLLVELAARAEVGEIDLRENVRREDSERVEDSGIWHLLHDAPELSLRDAAALVGAASDNWATNALLDRLGMDTVQERGRALAPGGSLLHDRIRNARRPGDPETLSRGCGADWAGFMAGLVRGEVVSPGVSAQVSQWLAASMDLSMVGSAFGFDPLAHALPDRGLRLLSKTGTDTGIRAEVGCVCRKGERASAISYAVLANWTVDSDEDAVRDEVLAAMRRIGEEIRAAL